MADEFVRWHNVRRFDTEEHMNERGTKEVTHAAGREGVTAREDFTEKCQALYSRGLHGKSRVS